MRTFGQKHFNHLEYIFTNNELLKVNMHVSLCIVSSSDLDDLVDESLSYKTKEKIKNRKCLRVTEQDSYFSKYKLCPCTFGRIVYQRKTAILNIFIIPDKDRKQNK